MQESRQRELAIYGLVSSREQKAKGDLDRQVGHISAAMAGQGFDPVVDITDVAAPAQARHMTIRC